MSSRRRYQGREDAGLQGPEGAAGESSKAQRRTDPPCAPCDDMQLEVALYIESISAELRAMAQGSDLEALAYFLEMARIEASIQVERRALAIENSAARRTDDAMNY